MKCQYKATTMDGCADQANPQKDNLKRNWDTFQRNLTIILLILDSPGLNFI